MSHQAGGSVINPSLLHKDFPLTTTTNASSFLIAPTLYLNRLYFEDDVTRPPTPPVRTHHIVAIDCSGSMANDLSLLRGQLMNRLPSLVKTNDTVTLIWFSGKDQYGTLLEAEPVAKITDFKHINDAISRWLKPVAMTGFLQPLAEAGEVVKRIRNTHKDGVFSLFFMSDGCDNQWPRDSIIAEVSKISNLCQSATFVEYGYYADRKLLTDMASAAGGMHVFAQDFPSYEPVFADSMSRDLKQTSRREIDLGSSVPVIAGDFVFSFVQGAHGAEISTYDLSPGLTVSIPDNLRELWFLSAFPAASIIYQPPWNSTRLNTEDIGRALYAALTLFSMRMKPGVVYEILRYLGDVSLIEEFSGCFGKQRYSAFSARAARAIYDITKRFTSGFDPSRVPSEDCFNVFTLLELLDKNKECSLLLDEPAFEYSYISRRKIQSAPEDRQLKFIPLSAPDGYSISNLTFNEERPNISVLVQKHGHLDLRSIIDTAPEHVRPLIPLDFPTHIYRNYAIVRDGIVNVEKMPMLLSRATLTQLQALSVPPSFLSLSHNEDTDVTTLDISRLPVLSRSMVFSVSAKTLLNLEFELTRLRARQKVWKHYRKQLGPPKASQGFVYAYGKDAADWLASIGITDEGGFHPKMLQAPATDFYLSKKLQVTLKGFASLPPVKEVQERMSLSSRPRARALTGGTALMAQAITEAEAALPKLETERAKEMWFTGQQDVAVAETRMAILKKAKMVFAIVVGQIWFKEWESLDENTMEIETPLGKVTGRIEMIEEEIGV